LNKWLERHRLGELFSSGELEALAIPEAERIPDLGDRLKALPAEDAGPWTAGIVDGTAHE
jgi:hypothetical protein